MKATTVKLSLETRDRIRALGGDTYEDTIVEALEADRFWVRAEAAADWRRSLPTTNATAWPLATPKSTQRLMASGDQRWRHPSR